MKKKISVIIPCYKDQGLLPGVVASIFSLTQKKLSSYDFSFVIIEDGSNQLSLDSLRAIPSCYLLRHPINLGQGAALQTGFEFCRRELAPNFVITMDADGQHSPEDLPGLIQAIDSTSSPAIIFGNRFFKDSNVPKIRRIILKAAVQFEKYLTGLNLNDAHNGYRIFNRDVLSTLELTQNRMAHATQFKQLIAQNKISYAEAPVQISYSEDSLAKGQRNSGSLLILRDLIKSYLFERS